MKSARNMWKSLTNSIKKLRSKDASTKSIVLNQVKQSGISSALNGLPKALGKIILNDDFLTKYIDNFSEYLKTPTSTTKADGAKTAMSDMTNQGDSEKIQAISTFIKTLLPKTLQPKGNGQTADDEKTFFTEKSLKTTLNNAQADKIITLLNENNEIKISDLQSNLGDDKFLKFLQLNDIIFDKYLKELSEKFNAEAAQSGETKEIQSPDEDTGEPQGPEAQEAEDTEENDPPKQRKTTTQETKLENFDTQILNAIIAKTNTKSNPKDVFKSMAPKIIDVICQKTKEITAKNLNDFVDKYLTYLKEDQENKEKNLKEFIEKIHTNNYLLDKLDLRNLQALVNLIAKNTQLNLDSNLTNPIQNKFIEKQSKELDKKNINLTTIPTKDSSSHTDNQSAGNSTAAEQNDQALVTLIDSIIKDSNGEYTKEALNPIDSKSSKDSETSASPKSASSYRIKDKQNKYIATFERTANGNNIKISNEHTDFLVKILEKLANDPSTKEISINNLSPEIVKKIIEDLEGKIQKSKTETNHQKQGETQKDTLTTTLETLEKLISKLPDKTPNATANQYDSNQQLKEALTALKYRHKDKDIIHVAARKMSKLNEAEFSPATPSAEGQDIQTQGLKSPSIIPEPGSPQEILEKIPKP